MSHILDVPGLTIGHATDAAAKTGVTAIVPDEAAVCGISVLGNAPGTRESDALRPTGLAPRVDAVVLSGGSAFGLAAADGVQQALAASGRGFQVAAHRIPIVPAAIVFDLSDRRRPDFAALGQRSVEALSRDDWREGSLGAGTNATTATVKGGIGSASTRVGTATVGAVVVMNAVGSALAGDGPHFRAAPFERDGEFGGLGIAAAGHAAVRTKFGVGTRQSTVIAALATDAALSQPAATRLAQQAHDGIALAVYPAHTLFDGDTVFCLATGRAPAPAGADEEVALGAAAAATIARAIARAVFHASPAEGDRLPTWHQRFG